MLPSPAAARAMPNAVLFNPRPRIDRVPLDDGNVCYVIDDALLEPERLVDWASAQRAAFRPVDFNAYPGNYLPLPPQLNDALQTFYLRHMRELFDARRLLHMHCRLAMVTLPPQALRPYQWFCHSDQVGIDPACSIQASVLYLFKDARLGGTGFYRAVRPAEETARFYNDATQLSVAAFAQRYGLRPGYMLASNDYFARTGGVEARFNRLIFYDGSILHSGDILAPERLGDDPRTGRLTLNGFFTSRRRAT
ncbi:hypothetical protein BV497_03195 [Fulvimonas soli]|nr:hypothetical protein BV497_03195 [Fulvimonas soli]